MKINAKFTLAAVISIIITSMLASAANLHISPSTGTYNVSDTFTVDIVLDTQSAQVDGVDINTLNYDASKLEVQDADTGTPGVQITNLAIFPITHINTANTTGSTGAITFSQINSGGNSYTGSASIARITFRALAAGSAPVTFTYTLGNSTDTNVASNGEDILSLVENAAFTINTPAPTGGSGGGGSGGGGSGGGSSGGGSGGGAAGYVCNMDWQCGDWSTCISGNQKRTCSYVKVTQRFQTAACPSQYSSPATTQQCTIDKPVEDKSVNEMTQTELEEEFLQIVSEDEPTQDSPDETKKKFVLGDWMKANKKPISIAAGILAIATLAAIIFIIHGHKIKRAISTEPHPTSQDEALSNGIAYAKRLRSLGAQEDQIKAALERTGWHPEDITQVMEKSKTR